MNTLLSENGGVVTCTLNSLTLGRHLIIGEINPTNPPEVKVVSTANAIEPTYRILYIKNGVEELLTLTQAQFNTLRETTTVTLLPPVHYDVEVTYDQWLGTYSAHLHQAGKLYAIKDFAEKPCETQIRKEFFTVSIANITYV